ncbi:MAG: hypothetical protein PF689_13305 [Deltaproteobacteria bacterium]|jgi:hypothetical protein|nr:hypothetical protein [Deltaproteobacteria bacterium]
MKTNNSYQKKIIFLVSLLFFLVFLAGGFAGSLFYGIMTKTKDGGKDQPPFHPPPGGFHLHRLGLDAKQRIKAREIGEKYRKDLDRIRKKILPDVEKIHQKMKKELIQILTPEQLKIHRQIEKEKKGSQDQSRRHPMGMGPPRRHPHGTAGSQSPPPPPPPPVHRLPPPRKPGQ